MNWSIKHFSELTTLELYQIVKLRTDVFVVEQQSIYSDCDNKDLNAYHIQLRDDKDRLVAYCRVLDKGVSYTSYSLGRVIVDETLRGTGYGQQLMQRAIQFVTQHWQGDEITISAQAHLLSFYGKSGFLPISEPYIEDGIPHIKMIWQQQ